MTYLSIDPKFSTIDSIRVAPLSNVDFSSIHPSMDHESLTTDPIRVVSSRYVDFSSTHLSIDPKFSTIDPMVAHCLRFSSVPRYGIVAIAWLLNSSDSHRARESPFHWTLKRNLSRYRLVPKVSNTIDVYPTRSYRSLENLRLSLSLFLSLETDVSYVTTNR